MQGIVSAHELVSALVHLAPEHHKPTILHAAKSTQLHLPSFAKAIREEIGGTLLFDAVMLLRGSSHSELGMRSPGAATALLQHCLSCRTPECDRTDCLELRGILSAMKAHAQSCPVPPEAQCSTCRRWQTIRAKMKRPRAASAVQAPTTGLTICKRSVEVSAAAEMSPSSGETSPGGNAAGTALLMLARSALLPVPPSSPRLSPFNSPMTSPSHSPRRKRPKPTTTAEQRSRAPTALAP